MDSNHDQTPENKALGPTTADLLFLLFLAGVLVCVTWLGVLNYREGNKTEDAKRNGEAWAVWLTEAGESRFEPDFKHPACKGGVKPTQDPSKSDTPVAGTWGACLAYLMAETELKDLRNSFFNELPKLVPQCAPSDRQIMGAIVLEDLMATPPGSPVPFVVTPLVESDPIDYKMQVRITVCDKGGYPVKITELEF
jgi:hypothetical protein